MTDPTLTPHTTERLLSGEPTGPPHLAALLTATTAHLESEPLTGEEAAIAAFRRARQQPKRRPTLISLKAALTTLAFLLAGGGVTALAATTAHLPGTPHAKHPHPSRPATSPATATPTPPRTLTHPQPEHSQKPAKPKKHPHPAKKQKDKHPTSNPHKPGAMAVPNPAGVSPVTHTAAGTVEGKSPCLSREFQSRANCIRRVREARTP
jgi:hypothetical protein